MIDIGQWRAGFGVGDITVYEPGLCLFGWGDPEQVCEGVAAPLSARAWVVEERATGRRVAYVCAELGMISQSLRLAVAARVCTPEHGLAEHDLMLTATHTHSGPNGYSTSLLYAVSAPGVSRRVHDTLVDGIVRAVQRAIAALRPARVWVHDGWIPASEPIAFNRALEAYNRNPDASPRTFDRRDEAVDRTMTVVRVDDARTSEPLGIVTWFAVHGTSVHADFRRLHGDNKGEAARDAERWMAERGHPDFVAIFAQGAAGDVTPNYRWSSRHKHMQGRYDDDLESARFAGEVQSRHARALWAEAREEGRELTGPLDAALKYRDFYDRRASARFARSPDARTVPPQLGIAFGVGTTDGPGPLAALSPVLPALTSARRRLMRDEPRWSWRRSQGAKLPLCDLGDVRDNRAFGIFSPAGLLRALIPSRFARFFEAASRRRAPRDAEWVPRRLPLQQVRIGSLLLVGLPNEPTTMAGRRVRESLIETWSGDIDHVVVHGYANAYCGYLTTPEEYDVQLYEGAATFYGRWSLPVFCTELVAQAEAVRRGCARHDLGDVPEPVPLSVYSPGPARSGRRTTTAA